jgi:hypothetical protein
MKTLLSIFVLTSIAWVNNALFGQSSELKSVFGISVSIQSTPDLIHFIAYQTDGSQTFNKRFLTRKEFLYYASGMRYSVYNPERINYFARYGIKSYAFKDSVYMTDVLIGGPVDSLWKLKFSSYPYRGNYEKGWSSEHYQPSQSQNAFLLDTYSMDLSVGGCVVDTNVWRLLRDIQDPKWVESYRAR